MAIQKKGVAVPIIVVKGEDEKKKEKSHEKDSK
jgi:hypothetical protein